jgi:hypothetical protein
MRNKESSEQAVVYFTSTRSPLAGLLMPSVSRKHAVQPTRESLAYADNNNSPKENADESGAEN